MVEFVPAGIAAPGGGEAHGLEAGLRGLPMPLQVAAGHHREARLRARKRLPEHLRLLLAAFAEHVVVRGTERGLPVAHQVDRAHAATRWRAIARRQRQCR